MDLGYEIWVVMNHCLPGCHGFHLIPPAEVQERGHQEGSHLEAWGMQLPTGTLATWCSTGSGVWALTWPKLRTSLLLVLRDDSR